MPEFIHPEIQKLLDKGFVKDGKGGLQWTYYYSNPVSKQRVFVEFFGPLPNQLKSITYLTKPIELDHSKCSYSTSICGHTTAGQGKLDYCGEWEFPCQTCIDKLEHHLR